MAHVTEVQPVALHIQRLDVPAPIRHQEELARLEDGPLQDGPSLRISHPCARVARLRLRH